MVKIEDYKTNPKKKIIDNLDIQIIYIPLENGQGYKYKETVKVGDYVSIGTILAENNDCDIPLLSTTSGIVVGFQDKYILSGKLTRCIVIENDFKEKYQNKLGKKNNITKCSKEEFIYNIKANAINDNYNPTFLKYNTKKKIDYFIINGTEQEIYSSSDNALMYNKAEEILECIDAIMEIMHIDSSYIAINENNSVIINKFLKHINTYPNIKIYPIPDGYPNGYDKYLIKEILSLKYKGKPENAGVICENVSTIYAIYESLKLYKPQSERLVTIAIPSIKEFNNYRLKIGTNLKEVLEKTNLSSKTKDKIVVAGGAMLGIKIPTTELIITNDLSCILITNESNEKPLPCIKCGKCIEVCPVNLIPAMIIENKKDLKIDKCINCGLCTYVCPSKIEIRERISEKLIPYFIIQRIFLSIFLN